MNPPPCVCTQSQTEFQFEWSEEGDQWLKWWCPNLVTKWAHLPPRQGGVRGSWPQRGFKYFTCPRFPPDTPGGKTCTRIPNGSGLRNAPPSEMKGKAKYLQTGNAWLASPPTNLRGSPLRASSSKEGYLTDGACSLYFKQTISDQESRKDIGFPKWTVPDTERRENLHHSTVGTLLPFGISTPLMPQDRQTQH